MGSGSTSSYMVSCDNQSKMNMNVSRDEVKFSVKLAVIFSFILPLEIRLNFEVFGRK